MKTTLVDVTHGVRIFLVGILIGLGVILGISVIAHPIGVAFLHDDTLGMYTYTGPAQFGVGFWDVAGFEIDGGHPGFFVCEGQC